MLYITQGVVTFILESELFLSGYEDGSFFVQFINQLHGQVLHLLFATQETNATLLGSNTFSVWKLFSAMIYIILEGFHTIAFTMSECLICVSCLAIYTLSKEFNDDIQNRVVSPNNLQQVRQ